jgi:GT2 family glycosyltransferase
MQPIPVCLTVRNDIKNIEACLESLKKQNYPYKLIAHDANSNDGTFEVIQKFKPCKLFRSDTNIPKGRNITVKEALKSKPKYVAIINSDVILPNDWLRNALKNLEKLPECGALGSYQRPPKSFWERVVYYITSYSMISDFSKKLAEYANIACEAALFRSKVFHEAGFFNEELNWTEDTELSGRIRESGYKIFYSKHIAIYHKFKSNPISYFKQQFYYGKGWKEWRYYGFKTFPLWKRIFHMIFAPWNFAIKEKNPLLPFCIYFYEGLKALANVLGRIS